MGEGDVMGAGAGGFVQDSPAARGRGLTVAVIGAGVSGLTTALELQRAGIQMVIHTEKLPSETTSAVAAAIWFPYRAGPKKKVVQWSRQSYRRLEALVGEETGITMVDLLEIQPADEVAWWLPAIPKKAVRKALPQELPPGFDAGYVLRVPMVETQLYLPYLEQEFLRNGGRLKLGKVEAIEPLLAEYDWVVNCTGLGARELVNDQSLFAIKGQLVKVDPVKDCPYVVANQMDGSLPYESTYLFPRRDCIVLGGTAIEGDESMEWDEELGRRLMARCKQLEPRLAGRVVQSRVVGLRPGRARIRLERQGRVIHNYGHGGAGFTVSWGCAQEVVRLLFAAI